MHGNGLSGHDFRQSEFIVIVLNLSCEQQHLFEGWFASSSAFEQQCAQGQVACPVCGSTQIERRPSAPYVNTGASAPRRTSTTEPAPVAKDAPAMPPLTPPITPEVAATIMAVLRKAAKGSEDVGERFPEEARKIHYGEAEARSIKGKASSDDLGELLEEGILVMPVPPDETDLH